MGQIVEGHITMTEYDPHHGEATQAIKTVDNIGVIDLLNSEDFGGVGKDGEGQEQWGFGFYKIKA